jgi:hypothetical protein
MKTLKTLSNLADPKYVLLPSKTLRYAVLAAALAASALSLVWVYAVVRAENATTVHYLLLVIMFLVLTAALSPRTWRVSRSFAADPKGVYFRTVSGQYLLVPWSSVGQSSLGSATFRVGIHRTVLLSVRVTDEEWGALVGWRPSPLKMAPDSGGYRKIGIGAQGSPPDIIQKRIEEIRSNHMRSY